MRFHKYKLVIIKNKNNILILLLWCICYISMLNIYNKMYQSNIYTIINFNSKITSIFHGFFFIITSINIYKDLLKEEVIIRFDSKIECVLTIIIKSIIFSICMAIFINIITLGYTREFILVSNIYKITSILILYFITISNVILLLCLIVKNVKIAFIMGVAFNVIFSEIFSEILKGNSYIKVISIMILVIFISSIVDLGISEKIDFYRFRKK